MPKPQPVPQTVVCSECGLSWDKHEKSTLAECVRLLKAELALRPQMSWTNTAQTTSGGGVFRSVA